MTNLLNGSGGTETDGNAGNSVAVLVIGAGPTGLLLASELHRHGISCHLVEARSAPLPWDRATIVHPRSLQIFAAMGLADKFLEAGCRQRAVKVHSDGKALGTLELSDCGSIYGFNLGISEEVTESILTEYLHKHGGQGEPLVPSRWTCCRAGRSRGRDRARWFSLQDEGQVGGRL